MPEFKLLDRATGHCNELPGGYPEHDKCDGVVEAPRSAKDVDWYVCKCPVQCHGEDPIEAAQQAVDNRYADIQSRRDERKEKIEGIREFYHKLDQDDRCFCGCGGKTAGGRFLPGHDSKLKSRLVKKARRRDKDAYNRLQVLEWTDFI